MTTRILGLLAAVLGLGGCAGGGGVRRAPAEATPSAPADSGDEADYPIRAWPLLESSRGPDGSRTLWATPFYHHTRYPDKSRSFHIFNYLQGPQYWAFLPFAYRGGEAGKKHTGVVPLYFGGPGYDVVPPALFLRKDLEDGGATTWVTPFFHSAVDGKDNWYFHLLNYFQGPDYALFFPLFYRVETADGVYLGVVPLYLQGPRSRYIPPLLTASWDREDGGTTTWATPLFRHADNGAGTTDVSLAGLVPLYQGTPRGWFFSLLACGHWDDADGSSTTWATPFFHQRRSPDGTRTFHVLNYVHGEDYDMLLPLAYWGGAEGARSFGIIPLYLHGPSYDCFPFALSGVRRRDDGSVSVWATPGFHVTNDGEGRTWWHFLNYFQGPRYKFLFPLAYLTGSEGARYWGIIPLYFQGPKTGCAPLLLSGSMPYGQNGRRTWITPLFHYTHDGEGTSWLHALTYFQGPDYKVLFPLAYLTGEEGARYGGIIPLYFQGPETVCAPLLLSGSTRYNEKGRVTWITPFFHHNSDGEGNTWLHALNYFHGPTYDAFAPFVFSFGEPGQRRLWALPFYMQGPDYRFLLPIAYSVGEGDERYRGIMPLFFESPRSLVVPPALYGRWDHEDGGRSTWVSPLFHYTSEADGGSWWHVLNYFQGPDYQVLFPLGYLSGEPGKRYGGIVPLYFQTPDMGCAPLLLSGWMKRGENGLVAWVTPFFHYLRNESGDSSFHALNYFQGPGYNVFFPLAFFYDDGTSAVLPFFWKGQDSLYLPPALSCWWRNEVGGETLWVTPFFHRATDLAGNVWLHVLNYFQSPHSRCLFPFFYHSDEGDLWTVPGYFGGQDYTCLPPLLSGWWKRKEGGESLWVTPLFHRTTDAAGESWWHLLNYFQGPEHSLFLPLYYSVGAPERRYRGVVPLYFETPTTTCVPPALSASWKREDGGRTTWATPLFHQRHTADGTLQSRHVVNWFQTRNFKTLFPLYFDFDDKLTIVPPVYTSYASDDGSTTRSVLWPLSAARTGGRKIDRSWRTQLKPFVYQRAGDDYEFNFLWRIFHVRREGAHSQFEVGPLWYSESGGEQTPTGFQILGGLVAKDCNYERGTYRYRLLWLIPLGGEERY